MAAVNLNNERIIWATWMLSKSIPISGSVKIAPSHPTDSSLYDLTPPSHHSTSHHSAHHSGVDHRGLGHVVPRHSTPHHAVIHHPATHEELAHTAHLHLLRIIPVAAALLAFSSVGLTNARIGIPAAAPKAASLPSHVRREIFRSAGIISSMFF